MPETGSVFTSWSGCTSVSGPVCSVAVTSAKTVTATFQPATYTVTTRTTGIGKGSVAGDGLNCVSGVCTVSVANTSPAQVVTFTAMPETGSVFTSWSGCTSVSGPVCSVAVTSARTVTATFQPATYTVTTRTTGMGKGSVAGDGLTCVSGVCTVSVANTIPAQVVTFTAVPEAGSVFTSWSGCTSVSGPVCSVAVTSARTVTATFQPAS
ncbi:InlB B-repeat-containing protein [Anaeromyxobacter terrae]|uniref:InlB B-repeat-containing protein n=1 Tax=Anaeromyxobacter terrae TaxID=2925406 RepID=UPI0038CC10F8